MEEIRGSTQASALEEIEKIRAQAKIEADEILEAARADAKAIREEERQEAQQSAVQKRAKLLRKASLRGLQIRENACEKLIAQILKRTRRRLQEFRGGPDYPAAYRRFIVEALQALSSSMIANETPRLEIDPRDRERIKDILAGLAAEIVVVESGETWGGVTVSSQDGRVKVTNTLEARLGRALPYLRASLLARLDSGCQTNPGATIEAARPKSK